MTVPLTPRERRIIADHVERLTKARVVNTQLGVATTPDLLVVDFPNSYTGTLIWTPARKGATGAERTAIARHARHRDCYQLDMATLTVTGGPRTHRDPDMRSMATWGRPTAPPALAEAAEDAHVVS